MQALYWNGRSLKLEPSYPGPKVDDQMALVRVRLAGICSTDLQIFKGYMGFHGVPGHEFVGTVSEGSDELVGKRVVGEINFACGRCEFCNSGLGRHCPERRVMGILGADGAFAEYVAMPVRNLHLVPESVADEEAVFTEPLAAAFEILEQVMVKPTDEVIVLGDGKLRLLCAQVLHLTGASVCLVRKHQNKLDILKKRGIPTVMLSDWRPKQADFVIEATGSTSGLKMALGAVRPRGTLVLKSTVAADHTLSLASLVINEVTVVGSRCGLFPPALQALAEKSVTVTPLIERIYPLNDGIEAVAHATRRGALKVLLRN
ncbi:MAG: alcohol dehydrogenase catalytic domain-containing protein [Deltaproteobacteria bacterium]|nr:alcohol dehydrogenase catalytic domain-containing protein [Deltaproteobacteria bacterium]